MKSKNIYETIGNNINYIRTQKGMTPAEFATYINATKTQLQYVMKGERGFSITKLCEISEITDFPLTFIITGKKASVEEDVAEKLKLAAEHFEKANDIVKSIISLVEVKVEK